MNEAFKWDNEHGIRSNFYQLTVKAIRYEIIDLTKIMGNIVKVKVTIELNGGNTTPPQYIFLPRRHVEELIKGLNNE